METGKVTRVFAVHTGNKFRSIPCLRPQHMGVRVYRLRRHTNIHYPPFLIGTQMSVWIYSTKPTEVNRAVGIKGGRGDEDFGAT